MNRLAFLKRLAFGLVAAPVVAEVVGTENVSDPMYTYPAKPLDIPVVRIPEKMNPRWKPVRVPSRTEMHEDAEAWFLGLGR